MDKDKALDLLKKIFDNLSLLKIEGKECFRLAAAVQDLVLIESLIREEKTKDGNLFNTEKSST